MLEKQAKEGEEGKYLYVGGVVVLFKAVAVADPKEVQEASVLVMSASVIFH